MSGRSGRPARSGLSGRSRRVRALRAGLWGLAAVHVAEAVVLRQRARALTALPEAPDGAAGRVDLLTVGGASVDPAVGRGAAAAMRATGAEVVDLVPGDLPARRALRLLRRVDLGRLRQDTMYSPGGAHEAVALHPGAAERLEVVGGRSHDRRELVLETVRAQRHAPARSDVRVAPGLRASGYGGLDRWRETEGLTAFTGPHGSLTPTVVAAEALHLLAMTAGLVVAPLPAVAALATWSAQPAVAFGGSGGSGVSGGGDGPALRPPDVARASVLRLVDGWADNLRTAAAGVRESRAAGVLRRQAPVPVAPPLEDLFEPRRDTCVWCGSGSLVGRVDLPDLLQHKQGTFHLDECRDCGHIFQNPALSITGLDHYYDEYYVGVGEEPWERIFAAMGNAYRNRVEAVGRFTTPKRWLDVGTGHGHFCLVAREKWPDATFDGLDMTEAIDEAERRGWIDKGHRGFFPDLADSLAGSYDVVSMHHYLEHTRDPRRELAAAATALEQGGHLMIEVPDTASPWSRRLGRYWRCWFQPQHQHFVTHDNMVAALGEAGFEVVSSERGPASEGFDLASAVYLALEERVHSPDLPWLPAPTTAYRAKRLALVAAALPPMALAGIIDLVKDSLHRRPGSTDIGNAYRLVARKL
jgi:SAM-dependent methyltransferase